MPSSWQVRLAALLVALDAVLGIGLIVVAARMLDDDPGFLFAVLPFVAMAVGGAGFVIATGAAALVFRLLTAAPGARVQATVLGTVSGVCGLLGFALGPWAGLLLTGKGIALVALMLTPAADRELNGWRSGFTQPAPWGSRPGTRLWSAQPQQQGPWSPDPTTVPWIGWKGHSGPRPPWWQTWRAGLRRGMPLWELLVLAVALASWLLGLVLALVDLAAGGTGLAGGALVLTGIGEAWLVERRMRARLAAAG